MKVSRLSVMWGAPRSFKRNYITDVLVTQHIKPKRILRGIKYLSRKDVIYSKPKRFSFLSEINTLPRFCLYFEQKRILRATDVFQKVLSVVEESSREKNYFPNLKIEQIWNDELRPHLWCQFDNVNLHQCDFWLNGNRFSRSLLLFENLF